MPDTKERALDTKASAKESNIDEAGQLRAACFFFMRFQLMKP